MQMKVKDFGAAVPNFKVSEQRHKNLADSESTGDRFSGGRVSPGLALSDMTASFSHQMPYGMSLFHN